MISFLRGEVAHVGATSVVLDVNGVGYSVNATPHLLLNLRLGHEITVHTSFIVREDSQTLFGFGSPDEREIFETLITVSGIGPRIGLAVLASMSADQVREAIANSDDKAFSKVSGIGPKTARRIVLELAGKLVLPEAAGTANATAIPAEVAQALVGLGWSEKDTDLILGQLQEFEPDIIASRNTPLILKTALQYFNGEGSSAGGVKVSARG